MGLLLRCCDYMFVVCSVPCWSLFGEKVTSSKAVARLLEWSANLQVVHRSGNHTKSEAAHVYKYSRLPFIMNASADCIH